MKRKRGKTMLIALAVICAALAVFLLFGISSKLCVRRYSLDAPQLSAPVKLVLITDLHSCKYGENQQELFGAIAAEKPDLVLLGGDIFDDVLPRENAELLLERISQLCACYYVTGNHEYRSGSEALEQITNFLVECGITRLSGESVSLNINGQTINICGVDDPEAQEVGFGYNSVETGGFAQQLKAAREQSNNGNYTVLLSHRPEELPFYAQLGFDLVLCGHAHGGQWRIPGILNGLIAPDQGFFPKYAGGEYNENGTVMIVSRGLATKTTIVPRVYNRPELVVIELY